MKRVFLLAAMLAAPLLLRGEEAVNILFKPHFKGIPAKEKSEKIFFKSAPALKLDGKNAVGSNHVGRHFYVFKEKARALAGKKLQLVMKLRRESGSAPLTVDYRIFGNGNKFLSGKYQSVKLPEKGKWVEFVMDFSVPPLDKIENFNAGCGFQQDGKVNNVIIVDEITVREVKQSGMVNVKGASLGAAALTMNKKPLVLIQNGKPQFKIVISPKADEVARTAAQELQYHTKLVCGNAPQIIRDETYTGTAVFIGSNAVNRKFGIAPEFLPLENWVIGRAGNAILISGGDKPNARYVFSRSTIALGTLSATYEFLERVFHIRWYWPGEKGIVAPKVQNLSVSQLYETGTPAYDCRALFYDISKDPDIPPHEVVKWQRRNRLGGSAPDPIGMHSFRNWVKDYGKAHPEYFALQPDGKRKVDTKSGTHLCLTNPAVVQTAANEAIAHFKKYPQTVFFGIMPGDCNDLYFCRCPKCQSLVSAEKGSRGKHSNAVWGFVNKVAAIVGANCPGKYIKCCAYSDYQCKPDFPLMPNVAVTLCYGAPPRGSMESYKQTWRNFVNEWRATGARLYFWEYWLPRYTRGVYGAPAIFVRQLKEIYLMDRTQISGRVIELSDINSHGVSEHAWADWMYDSLNLYMAMRLMWDPSINVEKELDLYFKGFYGPAAGTMREFYNSLEAAWLDGTWQQNGQGSWEWETCWRKVYPPAFVDRMMGLLRKAVRETDGKEPYSYRTKKTLTGYLPFEENSKMFRGVSAGAAKILNVPRGAAPKIDGKVESAEWKNAAKIGNFKDSYGVYKVKSTTEMFFRHDGKFLYAGIVCKYPCAADKVAWYPAKLGRHDGFLWEYESAELFFAGKDKEFFQFIIAPDNAVFDTHEGGKKATALGNTKWNSSAKLATTRFQGGWSAEIAIPVAELKLANPVAPNTFRSDFARNHRYINPKGAACWEQSMWIPTFGGFSNVDKFGTLVLK